MSSGLSHQGDLGPFAQPSKAFSRKGEPSPIATALRELHDLLEAYAPQWYRSEYQERSELGLRQGERGQAQALTMLSDLLEEYAPTWYSEECRKRVIEALEHSEDL